VVEWFWWRRVCGCGVSAFSMLMSWGLGRDGGLCGVWVRWVWEVRCGVLVVVLVGLLVFFDF
jgi:hypothetical protein